MTKLTSIDDEQEGRLLAAAIKRVFIVNAVVREDGKNGSSSFQIVTHDDGIGGNQLQRIRSYARGWKDRAAS